MPNIIKKAVFSAESDQLPEIIRYIERTLTGMHVGKEYITKTLLTAEELVNALINAAQDPEAQVRVQVLRTIGEIKLRITCKGQYFSLDEVKDSLNFETLAEDDAELQSTLGRMLKKVIVENNRIRHRGQENIVDIFVRGTQYKMLIKTLSGLFTGILVGLLIRFIMPETVSEFLSTNIFALFSEMFMNALKMIVAPLVFVSIMTSVSDFGDLASLGKIAVRVMLMYLLTSLIAIGVGWVNYTVFPIGNSALRDLVDMTEEVSSTTFSLRDTVSNIVPGNFISAFLDADMLQIIFIAVLLGTAAALLGHKADSFRKAIGTLNDVFSKATSLIIGFLPINVFCSMAKMFINMDFAAMSGVILWLPLCIFSLLTMLLVYGVLLLILARVRPNVFFRKFYPAMLTGFSTNSSFATVTTSMKQCDLMGISPKVYTFSVPLGATVNMDGSCILLTVTTLFMAKIFGIEISSSVAMVIIITIMALSIGAPGVPGSTLICMAVLFPLIGVPAEAVSLVMGLYPITAMVVTVINVTGDAAVSLIVAKSEKMLDMKKFNE